jgi:hypothetical protein
MDSWRLKMVPIDCPEAWIRNYHYTLSNSPEEHSSDTPSRLQNRSYNAVSRYMCWLVWNKTHKYILWEERSDFELYTRWYILWLLCSSTCRDYCAPVHVVITVLQYMLWLLCCSTCCDYCVPAHVVITVLQYMLWLLCSSTCRDYCVPVHVVITVLQFMSWLLCSRTCCDYCAPVHVVITVLQSFRTST